MDILTIYYQYSIRRLTWDIKKLKQNISSLVNLIWSFNDLQHENIRGPMRMVDKKNGVACANYDVHKF